MSGQGILATVPGNVSGQQPASLSTVRLQYTPSEASKTR